MPEREPRPAKLELELLATPATTTLVEHKRMALAAERVPLVLLLLVRVGVVAAVEAGAQLRVAQHLVRLVDGRHFLLGLLLSEPLLGRLVRVVELGQLAVGGLDLALVGVVGHTDDLVVVFCLATLKGDLGLLHERVDDVVLARVGFGGFAKSVDAGLELFRVQEVLGAVEQAVERVFVVLERFLTILLGLLAV